MFPTPAMTRWSRRASPIGRSGRLSRAAQTAPGSAPDDSGSGPSRARIASRSCLADELAGRRPDQVGRDRSRLESHSHGRAGPGAIPLEPAELPGHAEVDVHDPALLPDVKEVLSVRFGADEAVPVEAPRPPGRNGPAATGLARSGPRSPSCAGGPGGGWCCLQASAAPRSAGLVLLDACRGARPVSSDPARAVGTTIVSRCSRRPGERRQLSALHLFPALSGGAAVPGLPVEDRDRLVVDRVDLLVVVSDHGQADLSVLRDGTDHVEQNAGLRAVAVVEVVDRRDVEEVFGGEAAVRVGLHVVRRAVDLRHTARRPKLAGLRVEPPPVRNSSARNGCVVPPIRRLISRAKISQGGRRIGASDDEVDTEAAHDPPAPRGPRRRAGRRPGSAAGSPRPPETGIPGRPGSSARRGAGRGSRSRITCPCGSSPDLAARRADLRTLDELLDDSASRPETSRGTSPVFSGGDGQRDARQRVHDGGRPARPPDNGRSRFPRRRSSRRASERPCEYRAALRRNASSDVDDVVLRANFLEPLRQGHPRLAEDPPASGLRAEMLQLRIDAVQ